MSVLVANENYDFNSLKELLSVTDGNLASHLKALEKGFANWFRHKDFPHRVGFGVQT